MKLTTTAEALSAALRGNVVEKHTTLPVLAYARVQGDQIITTDLDNTCVADIDAKVTGKPDFLIPCWQIAKLLEGQTGALTLEYTGEAPVDINDPAKKGKFHVKLKHGGCTFRFDAMLTENFPLLPPDDMPLRVELDGDRFRIAIDRVIFSISNVESRYILNGALLNVEGGKLHLVATDGCRMSMVEYPVDLEPVKDMVIPRKALAWLKEHSAGPITLRIGTDYHAFKTGGKTLIFRKLRGDFPRYKEVIPKEEKIKVTATLPSMRQFRAELARVAMFSDERSGRVKFRWGAESLMTTKSERGAAEAVIAAKVEGEQLDIRWNAGYILDLLRIVEDGELTIKMRDRQSAALFSLDGLQYVAMPMYANPRYSLVPSESDPRILEERLDLEGTARASVVVRNIGGRV